MGMSIDTPPQIPASTNPVLYKFWRGVIRLWFALTFRKIRVFHEERLKGPDPAILLVSHPESFLDALILVAGFERLVRCLIPAGLIQGLLQPLLARGLGMISFLPEDRQLAL
jgi:1-acyl-sn-glycerol-3-phosphate acyltransferase